MTQDELQNILSKHFYDKEDDLYHCGVIDFPGGQITADAVINTSKCADIHGRRARYLEADLHISYDDESEEVIEIEFEM